MTTTKSAVSNQDLWRELDELAQRHQIEWLWVKGHAEDRDNARVDYLATKAAREQSSSNGLLRSASPTEPERY
jgi:ribonuclease HI